MDALGGIRVVDFTWALAGPTCTEILGFFGAEVIKIESRKKPDFWRRRKADPDKNVGFNEINLNKLGITLDLKNPESVELVKRLVKISDIVAENFSPGVMDRLGLGYAVLKEVNPNIIMLSESGCGSSGPEGRYLGYAAIFQANGGEAELSGYSHGLPGTLRHSVDTTVGSTAAFAILVALNYRQRTGKGQYIDLSAREVVSCVIGDSLMDYVMNGRVRTRKGNSSEVMAPHSCYRCRDEDTWVTIAVATDEEWQSLCEAMRRQELMQDERFADGYSRWSHREELDQLIQEWTQERTEYEATEELQSRGVAAFPSFNSRYVYEDPHLKERGFCVEVEHPKLGKQVVIRPPWKMSASSPHITRPSPLLGEHNEYVLGKLLGLPQEEIARLKTEEAIY